MADVKRIYVEKKEPYAVAAKELKQELKSYLGIDTLSEVRVLIRYDVESISEDVYKKALVTVFSEPPVDDIYEGRFPKKENDKVFSVECKMFFRRVFTGTVRPACRFGRAVCETVK